MQYSGLILDGVQIAGRFKFYTAEDCYGKRELETVIILSNYADIVNKKLNQQLKFVYAELINKTEYRIIDEFGKGSIVSKGHCWASNDCVIFTKVIFSKEPDKSIN